jgi:hypothetical protein
MMTIKSSNTTRPASLKSVSNLLLNFPTHLGVANATGTVTTKPNEIKTNKAVKAVIINILKIFYIDDQNLNICVLKITFL